MSTLNNPITLYEPASKTTTNKKNHYFLNQNNLIKFTILFEQFLFDMHGFNMVIELYSKKILLENHTTIIVQGKSKWNTWIDAIWSQRNEQNKV